MQTLTEFKSRKVISNGNSCFISMSLGALTQLKEIPHTNLLVSLNHSHMFSANLEIFDVSKPQPKKINAS